jgi:hypothetical protein
MASADLVNSVGSQPCDHGNRLKYHPHMKRSGRKDDPLYRARRLLTLVDERLNGQRREMLMGPLNAVDSRGEVFDLRRDKKLDRGLYDRHDPELPDQSTVLRRQVQRTIAQHRHISLIF